MPTPGDNMQLKSIQRLSANATGGWANAGVRTTVRSKSSQLHLLLAIWGAAIAVCDVDRYPLICNSPCVSPPLAHACHCVLHQAKKWAHTTRKQLFSEVQNTHYGQTRKILCTRNTRTWTLCMNRSNWSESMLSCRLSANNIFTINV